MSRLSLARIRRLRGLLAALAFALPGQAEAADLTILAEALEIRGALVVAVFDSEAAWRARKGPVHQATVPVTQPAVQARFADLPPGRYAIMAYHDRNGDGRLNTLPVGLPTEPYGFSNGARGTFGPPSWRAAAFETGSSGTVQSLRLR